jgi:hypothetical protein
LDALKPVDDEHEGQVIVNRVQLSFRVDPRVGPAQQHEFTGSQRGTDMLWR